MPEDLLQDPDVQLAYCALECPVCDTQAGRGLMLAKALRVNADHVRLLMRCIRCGAMPVATVHLPEERPEVPVATADDVLELHEALGDEGWWGRLTGR